MSEEEYKKDKRIQTGLQKSSGDSAGRPVGRKCSVTKTRKRKMEEWTKKLTMYCRSHCKSTATDVLIRILRASFCGTTAILV